MRMGPLRPSVRLGSACAALRRRVLKPPPHASTTEPSLLTRAPSPVVVQATRLGRGRRLPGRYRATARRALDDVPGVPERAPQNARGPATGASPRCRSMAGNSREHGPPPIGSAPRPSRRSARRRCVLTGATDSPQCRSGCPDRLGVEAGVSAGLRLGVVPSAQSAQRSKQGAASSVAPIVPSENRSARMMAVVMRTASAPGAVSSRLPSRYFSMPSPPGQLNGTMTPAS